MMLIRIQKDENRKQIALVVKKDWPDILSGRI